MKSGVRVLGWAAAVLLLVAVGAAAWLHFAVDPDDYRAALEGAARRAGVELTIGGALELDLVPELALAAHRVSLSAPALGVAPSRAEAVRFQLALWPLLQRRIEIRALELEGAELALTRFESAAAAPAAGGGEVALGRDFALAVGRILVTDGRLDIASADGSSHQLEGVLLDIQRLGGQGPAPFRLRFSLPRQPRPLEVALAGELEWRQAQSQLSASGVELRLGGLLPNPVEARLTGQWDLAAARGRVALERLGAAGLAASGHLDVLSTAPAPRYSLTLEATGDLARALAQILPETRFADPQAGRHFGLQLTAAGTGETLDVERLAVELDDARLTASSRVHFGRTPSLEVELQGGRLDLDRYRLLDGDPSAEQTQDGAPPLAPLAALAAFDGTARVRLSLDELRVGALPLAAVELVAHKQRATLSLAPLRFAVFGGTLEGSARAQLVPEEPAIDFQLSVEALDLAQAARHFAGAARLEGRLSARVAGRTAGLTGEALLAHLDGAGQLAARELYLPSLNVERAYCEAARLAGLASGGPESWPAGTRLADLQAPFTIDGGVVHLASYRTGTGNLILAGDGRIDLPHGRFDLRAEARLSGERTSDEGCAVDPRLARRALLLRCKDRFAEAGPTSCKPDPEMLESLLKGELLERLLPNGEARGRGGLEDALRGLLGR